MKVVIQRVNRASCIVEGKLINSINHGMMILVGFTHTDTIENVKRMTKKITSLRIFSDELGKMNLDIHQINGCILSISQFTLYANTEKGNRPSFISSMNPQDANDLYEKFNMILNNEYHIITKPGVFGGDMKLDIECDGPVTIEMEN